MHQHPVFFDPKGFRRKGVLAAFVVVVITIAVVSVLFWTNLNQLTPFPKPTAVTHHTFLDAVFDPQVKKTKFLVSKAHTELTKEIDREKRARTRPKFGSDGPIVSAFYTSYEENGIQSLRENASKLTHLMPEWMHLSKDGETLDLSDWDPEKNPKNEEVVSLATANGVQIHPILNNSENSRFDPERVKKLLDSPAKQERFATSVVKFLIDNDCQGLNLDFEALNTADSPRLIGFLKLLKSKLAAKNLALSVDCEVDNEDLPLKKVADNCDFIVLMAYDEHSESDEPGPIAGADWTEEALDHALKSVPPEKLVLGVGNYAYDWTVGVQKAHTISYQEALTEAQGYRDAEKPEKVIQMDPGSLNNHFSYRDEDEKLHRVWLLDGVSVYNQWMIAKDREVRGSALWLLGQEDPSLWSFLNRNVWNADLDTKKLDKVVYPYEVDYPNAFGEILRVKRRPADGTRSLEIDKDTGLATDCTYHSYASSYQIGLSGYLPKKLALTFDDGPDPTYSPQILDILKETKAPGTFFIIGNSAETHPGIVQRMFDEGHEIGSHTFTHPNMGTIGDKWARLELNATQRAIQTILGRSTILFRPPFNADAQPTKVEEVKPVDLADQLGYVTVGERIDPRDWDPDKRTPEDLVQEIVDRVHQGGANVILLHDGGGNRDRTVKALALLIPRLRSEGYVFVPVSTLMGTNRDGVMPRLTAREMQLMAVDKTAFWLIFTSQAFLALAFVTAITLGVARAVAIVPLALVHEKKRRGQVFDPAFNPLVSVLIAAFNEEKVIERTIRSILASNYSVHEVIVVDDGSRDLTAEVIATAFGGDSRVRVVRQENSGKADALNHGLALAAGEIIVCVDADTQLDSNAVAKLVRHFQDPKIGAVAGNVKVGNRINLLTQWQSIEYITSQNMDRRAYALLNAVTVVPGAIGAWRRKAVLEAGGYLTDTLAEDMDLTWRLRRKGWKLETDNDAIAHTEAPDSLKAFFNQRFRWAYGTLQCLWKHRRAVGRYGWFGTLALPSLWLFQILFQAIAPLVDLQLLYCVYNFVKAWLGRGGSTQEIDPLANSLASLQQVAVLYVLFLLVEYGSGLIAYKMDKERARGLWGLFFQRFVYRQIMYGVIYKSLAMALQGLRQGWNKVERKATVRLDHPVAGIE